MSSSSSYHFILINIVNIIKMHMFIGVMIMRQSLHSISLVPSSANCLAITHFNSYRWYHHVDSKNGRNLAINVWIHHLSKFNASDCNATPTDESRFVSVAKFMQDNKKIDLRSEKIAQTHELGISLLYNMTNYFTSGVPFFQRFSTWRARG